jgi:hypothetical protein
MEASGEGEPDIKALRDVVPFWMDKLDMVSSSPPSADVEEDAERLEEREREWEWLLARLSASRAAAAAAESLPLALPAELRRDDEEAFAAAGAEKSWAVGEEEGGFHSSPSRSAESFKVGEFVSSMGEGSPLQVRVGEMPPEEVGVVEGCWRTWGLRMERGGGWTGLCRRWCWRRGNCMWGCPKAAEWIRGF